MTAMGESFSFLLDASTFRCYCWETLDMLRKLVLVGLVLLVKRGSVAQNISQAVERLHPRPHQERSCTSVAAKSCSAQSVSVHA